MFPVILELGPIIIYSLWLFIGIAFIAGVSLFSHLAKERRLNLNFIYKYTFQIFLFGLIGARLLFVARHYSIYLPDFSLNTFINLISIWDKGLSLVGALLGIIISITIYSLKEKEQTLKWLDTLTIATITGLAIGHIGAFLDGINYGNPTNLFWGITFDNPSIKYAVDIHPTQLYAFIYSAIIAIVLFFLYKKAKFKSGKIMKIGIIAYFTMVFLEGFVRGDDVYIIFGIRDEQWFALLILLITGGFIIYRYNKKRSKKTLTIDNHDGSI